MPVLVDGELVLYGFCGDDFWDEGFTAREVLDALAELGRDADVMVRINSGGGYIDDGKAIFNALKAHAGRVTVSVDAVAASAAAIIAMGGDEIVMRTGAIMMIHEASGYTVGFADDHRQSAGWLDNESAMMASIWAERSGLPINEVRALMKAETWMTPDEAVDRGFADRADGARAGKIAAFAYHAYAHAPKPLKAAARKNGWSLADLKRAAASAAPPRPEKEQSMTDKPKAEADPAIEPEVRLQRNEPATPEPPRQEQQQPEAGLDAARAEARAEGRAAALAYVSEVNDLCALAGCPARAGEFIAKNVALTDVRKALIGERASADAGRQITTHLPPGTRQALPPGTLAASMKRLVEKEA